MKKLQYIKQIVGGFMLLLLVSCDSIFVQDPIDPRLPKYTENGNNVAGAYVMSEVWKSAKYGEYLYSTSWGPIGDSLVLRQVPTIISKSANDSLIITFDGKISKERTIFEFRLSNTPISTLNDLNSLREQKIAIDGKSNMGVYLRYDTLENIRYAMEGGIGQLYIKNVTIVDSIKTATLSGTFGFTVTNSHNAPIEITYGRFDYTFKDSVNFMVK